MKEKLIDIVKSIDDCGNARKHTRIDAVARVHCMYNGCDETFWFSNNVNNISMYDYPELKQFGRFVPKNSNVAIKLQISKVGDSFDYDQLDYNTKRHRNFHVSLENRSDFQNHKIEIAGESIAYQYRDIHEFLLALQEKQKDIREVQRKTDELRKQVDELKTQQNTSHQRGQITKDINELQREYRVLTQQQEDLKNITIYIRKQGEMRYSLIVDPIQTRIKTQNLFDGNTVIIDGGPGTGKSTTMIHRLAYLTDTFAIDEDETGELHRYKLDNKQRKQLRNAITAHRDWMFFSPSQLLKEYLADAMKKERLANTAQKVWYWNDYCQRILEDQYHLLKSQAYNAPFEICYQTDVLFYQNSGIVKEFENYYLSLLRQIKDKLPKLDSGGVVYEWTSIANNIRTRFEQSVNYDISHFISLFNTISYLYENDCRRLIHDNNKAIDDLSTEMCALLDKNTDAQSELANCLGLPPVEETHQTDEPQPQESKSQGTVLDAVLKLFKSVGYRKETEQSDKEDTNGEKAENRFFDIIRKWVKSYGNHIANDGSILSANDQSIANILIPIIGNEYDVRIRRIGELTIFEQYAKYTRGVSAIMLKGLASTYKGFRNHLIRTQFPGCNLQLLSTIKQRKQGAELHYQEQSLLLGFINNLVKKIQSTLSTVVKHEFIDAYNEVSRPIIGIDEATDFSVCEIYAMQSLLSRDFNSLTLCGDMMQRLTSHGITSWSELNGIVPNPTVVEMKTSYRQSVKLLEVARHLYMDTLGETPLYRAYLQSEKVPAPLVFIDENETSKIQWISKRIEEVFRAYGEQMPSVAIFVTDKGYIPDFIERLQSCSFFSDKGVKVLDGTKEGRTSTENHICVYPINVVKGMEFDVVFFHNIDHASVGPELMKRYIYVGVSRAAFFLAVTLSEHNDDISKYFVMNKDWFNI